MGDGLILKMYQEQIGTSNPWVIVDGAGRIIISNQLYIQRILGLNGVSFRPKQIDPDIYPELLLDIASLQNNKDSIIVLREIGSYDNKRLYHVILQALNENNEKAFMINLFELDQQYTSYPKFLKNNTIGNR